MAGDSRPLANLPPPPAASPPPYGPPPYPVPWSISPAPLKRLRPLSAGPSDAISDPRLRRQLIVELIIVLAVFPFPYVVNALIQVALHFSQPSSVSGHFSAVIPGNVVLSAIVGAVIEMEPLAAAALVLYLLWRGGEGWSAIGLDRRQRRGDIAMTLPVWLFVFLIPQGLGNMLLYLLHVHAFATNDPTQTIGYLPPLVVSSFVAGIVEEIVVLGFLVRRLEQFGLRSPTVVMIAVAVRISYHLYYGPGVLPILLWAIASVIVYRKTRRLWPFIMVHALWDASIFVSGFTNSSVLAVEAAVLLPTTIVLWALWHRDSPPIVGSNGDIPFNA